MALAYVLFEHSTGYALFAVKRFHVIGPVLDFTKDYARFKRDLKLVAFSPFSNASEAFENIINLTEGALPKKLYLFLETYLPKEIVLGIMDVELAQEISKVFNVKCEISGGVPNLIAGIKMHFHRVVEGITPTDEASASRSLDHTYSRTKLNLPRTEFEQRLCELMEDRVGCYESGKTPKNNAATMTEADSEMMKEKDRAEEKKLQGYEKKKKKRLM